MGVRVGRRKVSVGLFALVRFEKGPLHCLRQHLLGFGNAHKRANEPSGACTVPRVNTSSVPSLCIDKVYRVYHKLCHCLWREAGIVSFSKSS